MAEPSAPPSSPEPAPPSTTGPPSPSPGVLAATIGDELVLYDPDRGRAHRLNRSAAAVWEGLQAGLSGDELVAVLADAFAVDPAAVATDVATMLDVLAGEGLVAGAGLRAPAPAPPPVQGSWLTLPPADEPPGQAPAPHPVPPVLALHTGVELATSSAEVSAYLGELLAPLRAPAGTAVERRFELVSEPGGVELRTGDKLLRTAIDWPIAIRQVVIGLNHLAAHPDPADLVTVHAGAVAIDGRVVLLAGEPGAGKSTLVTALVADGATYLSDEVVGLADDGTAVAFPKVIALELDAEGVLGELPSDDAHPDLRDRHQRLVDPHALGVAAAPGTTLPLAAVVLPTYVPGALGAATACDPVEALLALLANAFNLAERGAPGLALLADVAVSLPVVRLEVDDLTAAVATVRSIVAGGEHS
ncbi:MAG: PqqD family peptide modification chaperone [Acidimicrobiales bacterium]|nr:PqqD family peptide modification chaperone [Acidimicrobiales bacterium]